MQINQNKWKKRLILLSFVASIFLTTLKFIAYFITSSNAILSDAFESIINVLASGFAFYSIRLAAQPKDSNHPYGHGKIEFFSAGFEGALIVMASAVIIYLGIYRLLSPVPLENLSTGAWFVSFSAVANGGLGYLLMKEGKKMNSLALVADGKHLLSDAVSSLALIISIFLIMATGWIWIDAVSSLIFGLFIAISGLKLVRKSVAGLMDETEPAVLEAVVEAIRANKKNYWVDVHNVRVQQYGSDLHIDCHLTLPYYWSVQQSHEAVIELENVLKNTHYGETEIFVHTDPCLPDCCGFCRLENCPVRSTPFLHDIEWDAIHLAKNQKLYINQLDTKKIK